MSEYIIIQISVRQGKKEIDALRKLETPKKLFF